MSAFVHRLEPGTSATTVLVLHGTGGDENDLLPLARELAPGATLLSPRGKVLENGMPRFFRRLAAGVFDEDDLRARTHELASFVRSTLAAQGLDGERVVAIGYSNGANIAAALMLLEPDLLQAAVLLRPVLPLEPATLPDLSGRAALLLAGRQDPWSAVERVEALASRLEQAGAEVDLRWQPTGHGLLRTELDQARQWLEPLLEAAVPETSSS